MRKLLLASVALLAFCGSAHAQVGSQCIGVGGVNNVPIPGIICQEESITPTYAATAIGLQPGTAPTDIACLIGSATKVVRVKEVRVSGTAGTAINIVAVLIKRASIDTGGTTATSTALPSAYTYDATNASPTASTTAWTANPTINDSNGGLIGAQTVFLPATGSVVPSGPAIFYWNAGQVGQQAPILRSAAQQLCVNLNGVTTPSSGLMTVQFIWTEANQ